MISSQYRAGLNFTPDVMQGARKTVQRLDKVAPPFLLTLPAALPVVPARHAARWLVPL